MRRWAPLVALVLAGCAADDLLDDGERPDGAVHIQDARLPDATLACTVRVTVMPAEATAPATIAATATADGGGFTVMSWTVAGPGDTGRDATTLDSSGLRISFVADVAGGYAVGGTATVNGRACLVVPASLNVRAATARRAELRLRYLPQPGQGASVQDDPTPVMVYGGGETHLAAPRVLAGAVAVAGRVHDAEDGAVPAYLRASSPRGAFDLFTDGAGRYAGLLPRDLYELLVVPYAAGVAPRRFTGVDATAFADWIIGDGARQAIRVVDPGGAPLAAVRVAAGADGAFAVTSTAGDGTAWVPLDGGAPRPVTLELVPPLPWPRLRLVATLDGGAAPLEIPLPSLPAARLALTARDAAGAALPGARITLAATLGEALSARAVLVAADGGHAPPLTLPQGRYEVVVEPPPGATAVLGITTLEIDGDRDAAVAAARPAITTLRVVGPGAAPVAGARVTAVARGLRGAGAGHVAAAFADAAGDATLALVPGMTYDVAVDPPSDASLARAHAALVGGAPPEAPLLLAAAVPLRGELRLPSNVGVAGVRVEALCASCATPDRVLAETITGPGGAFTLWVPDPGLD